MTTAKKVRAAKIAWSAQGKNRIYLVYNGKNKGL